MYIYIFYFCVTDSCIHAGLGQTTPRRRNQCNIHINAYKTLIAVLNTILILMIYILCNKIANCIFYFLIFLPGDLKMSTKL